MPIKFKFNTKIVGLVKILLKLTTQKQYLALSYIFRAYISF